MITTSNHTPIDWSMRVTHVRNVGVEPRSLVLAALGAHMFRPYQVSRMFFH